MMSRNMAKRSSGAQVIERPGNQDEAWLLDTAGRLAAKAKVQVPGVAIYKGYRRPMIDALRALGNLQAGQLPKETAASGIAGGGMMALFSSHPPLETRIAELQPAN